jgi:hypothetical protein
MRLVSEQNITNHMGELIKPHKSNRLHMSAGSRCFIRLMWYYQHRFAVNVWSDVICDQLIGPYIFPQRLTGDIYANVSQDKLPELLENVPLQM